MLDGCLLSAGARTQSVVAQSSCEAEYIGATAATSEAKYIQSLFLTCGQHVNIHLRSDSTGAIGVASRRGLQRLRQSGRAVSLVASRDCRQACSYQLKYPVLRTWQMLTPNLQTDARSNSVE